MKHAFVLVFFLIQFLSFGQSARSLKATQIKDTSKTRHVTKVFKGQINQAKRLVLDSMQAKGIPGLSIAVAKHDQIVWAEGFGFSDLENHVPVKMDSKFRIGSVSKVLTGLAIGKLIDTESVKLSDDINQYILFFPLKEHTLSIADLVSHSSGIRNYNHAKGEFLSNVNYQSVKESISIFQDDSLLFEPGTDFAYSTYNYVLLSAVIEGATTRPFIDYMQDSILAPLRLSHTEPDHCYAILKNRVRFYDTYNGILINSPAIDNSNKWAGGGYLSTPLDLVKIGQSLLKDDFITPKTKQVLWTPAVLKNGKQTNYGIGWRIDKDSRNRTFVHHGGSSVGGRSFLLMYPEDGLIIAITSNLSDSFNQDFVLRIADIFL